MILSILCSGIKKLVKTCLVISGRNVRLVNRRFKIVVENIMNCGFKNVEKQLATLKKSIAFSLAYTQEDMEIKCLSKLLSMLDLLQMQVR